ncbi:hypothetical protein ANCDUO_25757 [Ancylostoma duodenale]|uniref:RRM domain-containing protein n=1 Tax=Ancylostoma duodenale TaxID=51022 RepID=A0A0C2F6R7_9BILA|nr:hypothetical protein ANCDUO_25757 [Ancylostoma duodenale]
MYGPIKSCDLPPERFYTHLHRGYGYVEYENAEDAEKHSLSSIEKCCPTFDRPIDSPAPTVDVFTGNSLLVHPGT